MKVCRHLRMSLVWLLLLGFSLQSVGPIALEPDHYLAHGSLNQTLSEERVELHGEDGDHHHQSARLELGQSSHEPHCHLCAHFGPQALLLNKLSALATVDIRPAALPNAAFVQVNRASGPHQPRAPPRV